MNKRVRKLVMPNSTCFKRFLKKKVYTTSFLELYISRADQCLSYYTLPIFTLLTLFPLLVFYYVLYSCPYINALFMNCIITGILPPFHDGAFRQSSPRLPLVFLIIGASKRHNKFLVSCFYAQCIVKSKMIFREFPSRNASTFIIK